MAALLIDLVLMKYAAYGCNIMPHISESGRAHILIGHKSEETCFRKREEEYLECSDERSPDPMNSRQHTWHFWCNRLNATPGGDVRLDAALMQVCGRTRLLQRLQRGHGHL